MSQTLQAALTVLGGVFVFVAGQVIVKFFIEPFHERSELLGEIAGSLIYYSNTTLALEPLYAESLHRAQQLEEPLREITINRYEELIEADWKRCAEAKDVLRRQASQLMSTTTAIPMYSLWAALSLGGLRWTALSRHGTGLD